MRAAGVASGVAPGVAAGGGAPPRHHDVDAPSQVHHQTSAPGIVDGAGSVGIAGGAKTWVGTVACALATTLGALAVARLAPGLAPGLAPVEAVLAGVLAAAAERPRWRFDDNLRVVLAVGAGILLWRLAFS